MRLIILSACSGLLVAALITFTYSGHDSFSVLVSAPLVVAAGTVYPGHDDWIFATLMITFGSLLYGFFILLFAVFVREIIRHIPEK